MVRAKKARPKRHPFPFFRLPNGTTPDIPSMSTPWIDRREGVCDHRTCAPLETLVKALGLSRDSGLSSGMILLMQEFGMESREGAESAQPEYVYTPYCGAHPFEKQDY